MHTRWPGAASEHELLRCHELVRRNLARNRAETVDGAAELSSTAPFLKIDTMGGCNMRPYCCICDLDAANPIRHTGLDIESLRRCGRFIDQAERIWDGSTGEALLHPRFVDFIADAASRGKLVGFTTGGLALTAARVDRLAPLFACLSITVSLDAATAETYARLRGNRFDQVVANIRYLLARRKEAGLIAKGEVGLCFIPCRTNRHEAPQFVRLAASLGADFVVFRPLHRRPVNKIVRRGAFTFDYFGEMLSEDELERCREDASRAARETGMLFHCQYQVAGADRDEEYKPRELEQAPAPCVFPWRFAKLVHDGQTFPCVYITESMGDWQRDGLDAVWNSEKWRTVRRELAQGSPAGLCFRAPSCPIVRRHLDERSAAEIAAFVDRSTSGAGVIRLSFCDKGFLPLEGTGMYEPDASEGHGREFRWLGREARWRLPNPFPGRPGWMGIVLRTTKPDVERRPLCLTLAAEGLAEWRFSLASRAPKLILRRLPPCADAFFGITVKADNPWRPRDYPECGHSADGRELSAQVTEVVLADSRLLPLVFRLAPLLRRSGRRARALA